MYRGCEKSLIFKTSKEDFKKSFKKDCSPKIASKPSLSCFHKPHLPMKTSTLSVSFSQMMRYIGRHWLSSLTIQRFVIICFAVSLYFQTAFYDYATDSARLLSQSQVTHKGIGIDAILHMMMHETFEGIKSDNPLPSSEHYQPFTIFTFAAEYSIFGIDPHISHLINIVLYALTGLLLLSVINRIFKYYLDAGSKGVISFVAVLIFIAHPLHTEVVASVKGRNEILSFLWLLLMTYLLLRASYARASMKLILLPLVAISFFLALLTEVTAVTFLLIVPLMLYFFVKLRKQDYLVLGVPVALTAGTYWLMRDFFLKKVEMTQVVNDVLHNPLAGSTAWQKVSTIIYVFGKCLQLLIFPHPLSHDYSFGQIPIKDWYDPFVLLTIAIYALMGFFAIRLFRKKSLFSFAYFCFLGYLVVIYVIDYYVYPNEFVFLPRGTLLTERLLYLPSLPFAMAASYFVYQLFRHLVSSRRGRAIKVYAYTFFGTSLILFAYSGRTIWRNFDWQNKGTLLAADIKNSPYSVNLRIRYADFLKEEAAKRAEKKERILLLSAAAEQIKAALEVYPDYLEGLTHLGDIYLRLQRIEEAQAIFEQALEKDPNCARAQGGMGRVQYLKGNFEKATEYSKRWVVLSKKNNTGDADEAFFHFGRALEKTGAEELALSAYKTATIENPQHAAAYSHMAMILEKQQKHHQALENYHKAVAADKYMIEPYLRLSRIYQALGEQKKATITLEEAIKINPEVPNLYQNLAELYQKNGDIVRAEVYFAKASVLEKERKE
jgi:tetratricopeptide (TPR) repeat protein